MQPAPFIGWVDYSPAERDRMRQALALFSEDETRDELGLGAIRDALADLMFPGTSTLQTRLRYFLFVPWIYQELERSRVTSDTLASRLRKRELDLIDPLKATGAPGVFGSQSGHAIERLPSGVYWNGLRTWGLIRFARSQEDFHRAWDELGRRRRQAVAPEDDGVEPDDSSVWDPSLPAPPSADWVRSATLDLTYAEASYLRDRMHLGRCQGSLLGHWATSETRPDLDSEFPWGAAPDLPPMLEALLHQAEAFSLVMHGAALLYNLALSRKSQHAHHRDQIPNYEASLKDWADHVSNFEPWKPHELWSLLEGRGVSVPDRRGDRRFVDDWTRLVQHSGPFALVDSAPACRLIEQRELALKKIGRSRFHSPRALDRWSGASGTRRLNYRWHQVRTLLRDLYAGLDQRPTSHGGHLAIP